MMTPFLQTHPLCFEAIEWLVRLNGSKPTFDYGSLSYPNVRDWQKE